jgi:hypothetical protein
VAVADPITDTATLAQIDAQLARKAATVGPAARLSSHGLASTTAAMIA